jgi:hypothetical protein
MMTEDQPAAGYATRNGGLAPQLPLEQISRHCISHVGVKLKPNPLAAADP